MDRTPTNLKDCQEWLATNEPKAERDLQDPCYAEQLHRVLSIVTGELLNLSASV